MVAGLTGRYCSGKSTVGSLMQEQGWHVIEVDHLGHQALVELQDEVVDLFGKHILSKEGRIDRRLLGREVFKDSRRRMLLEAIVHPWMFNRCSQLVAEDRIAGVDTVINAALLHRMGLDRLCDIAIYVRAPLYRRYLRGKFRDGTNLRDFFQREGAQKHIRVYNIESIHGVFCLNNRGNRGHIQKQLQDLLRICREKGY